MKKILFVLVILLYLSTPTYSQDYLKIINITESVIGLNGLYYNTITDNTAFARVALPDPKAPGCNIPVVSFRIVSPDDATIKVVEIGEYSNEFFFLFPLTFFSEWVSK